MKTPGSLKNIEQRAYRSTFEDGIYDILFGIVFLILAWIPVLESINIPKLYGYLFILIPVLITWSGKKLITIPRLGSVEFGPKRKTKRLLLVVICAAIFFLQLPLLMIMGENILGSMGGNYGIPLTAGLIVAPLLVVAAYYLDYPRMYIYALVLMFGMIHSNFMFDFVDMPFNSLISFGIPGLAITAYGLMLLFKFLKKYMRSTGEVPHVS